MNADRKRHERKIVEYKAAVSRVGFSLVESKIGEASANKFELASDAHSRHQHESIVADFLADAQDYGESFCGLDSDQDIYCVLKSI